MKKQLLICTNRRLTDQSPSCAGAGAEALADELERLAQARGLPVTVTRSTCLGRCEQGPNLRFAPGGDFLGNLSMENLTEVIGQLERFLRES